MATLFTTVSTRVALVLGTPWFSSTRREEGQTFVEYALILALIGVGLTVALTGLRDQIASLFTTVGNDL
jgi:Flp pilus assembly pilin Flp